MNNAVRNVRKTRFDQSKEKYSIIIPAAGKGTRLKNQEPKCLIKLDNYNTVLSRQIKIINELFPTNEIILVVGHEANYIMNQTPNNIIKIENEKFDESNVTRSISIGLRAATTERVILMMGDLVFSQSLLSGKFQHESVLFTDNKGLMKDEEIGCSLSGKKDCVIEGLMFNFPKKWAQIAYFTGIELDLLKKIAWKKEKGNLFAFELINEIIDNGGKFTNRANDEASVVDIDVTSDLTLARQII